MSIKNFFETKPEEVLFHYTTQQGLIGIIQNKSLWATKIQYLNDAKEMSLTAELVKSRLHKLMKPHWDANNPKYDKIISSLRSVESINIFVFSLSEKGDLLSQWRAYSQNGIGYSIGFEYDLLENIMKSNHFKLAKCIYDINIQYKIIDEIINEFMSSFSTMEETPKLGPNSIDEITNRFSNRILQIAPMLKDKSFEEEQEWRLISEPKSVKDDKMRYREGKSMVIPYFELEIPGSFNKLTIFVGPNPHMELSLSSVSSILSSMDWKYTVYTSGTPFRTW